MAKKIGLILLLMLGLVGCSRQQQDTNMVDYKEVPSDFTTQPQAPLSNSATTPMLPGKAQLLGAPFDDFPTQTGTATVTPAQNQTVSAPQVPPQ